VVVAPGYLRFPHICGDLVTFVAADDVWLAPIAGGRAWRFTADAAWCATPRFSADGTRLAWTTNKDGASEIYQATVADGVSTRLTYWGASWARVCGWTQAGEVIAASPAGQPFGHYVWARTLDTDLSGGDSGERLLPYGPVADLSVADRSGGGSDSETGAVALLTGTWGSFNGDPAYWKRYRGGTGGRLWLGPATALGSQQQAQGQDDARVQEAISPPARPFRRLMADLPGQFSSPMLVGGRLAFLSDHEGTGNIYSCAPDGTGLRRHTDHDGWYARQASTDGERIVYMCGGELWLLDDLDRAAPNRLDIVLGSPASGRMARLVSADDHVGSLSVDRSGTASAVEVRGTVHWLTHRDGPARALSVVPGVRARFPQVLADGGRVVWATDAGGIDALEIRGGDPADLVGPAAPPRRLGAGQLGRITGVAAAPDGSAVAVAARDGRLHVVDVSTGAVRELTASGNGYVTGLAWSPDSAWLTWSEPAGHPVGMGGMSLRRLRLARIAGGQVTDLTDGRFTDTDPVFTHDGKYLAFLSRRSFDPVYDAHFFDLSFPYGARPYLLLLQAAAPSPFGPQLGGRPIGSDGTPGGAGESGGTRKPGGAREPGEARDSNDAKEPAPTRGSGGEEAGRAVPALEVDLDGIAGRLVALPVPEARYSRLRAVKDGLAWLREPVTGSLGLGGAQPTAEEPRPVLERFDFGRRESCELAEDVDWFEASGDGNRIVISDRGDLTVIPGGHRADSENPDDKVRIDGTRARFMADPVSMWQQAYAEACRIMRHDFWIPDLADVDLAAVADEYRPLLDRITSQAEFGDVLREAFGELGTSHAYVYPGSGLSGARSTSGVPPGLLGADLERTPGGWQVTRVVRGESSDPRARSPLSAPGVGVTAGDVLLAVDGRPAGPDGLGPLLVGAAGKPVELTVVPAASGRDGSGQHRNVAVVPLRSDHRLRYLDWVSRKRDQVRELTGGRVGYLHVPDMVSEGWADFHRDLRSEMLRDALVVDVRGNTGGHTSQLVIEKLSRRVIGWDVPSGALPATYPEDAPRGPVVALADECAGSDGDIVTAAIRILQLGPVVGARTWGGVIGYDDLHELVDGTQMTVPRLAFWLDGFGWGVENYGVEPDVELIPTPDDWAAGRDVQLEAAVRLALEALRDSPAVRPPDPSTRPSRRRPPLPPRSA
jgi:tricorn protease